MLLVRVSSLPFFRRKSHIHSRRVNYVTDCLIIADGSEDPKIKSEGLASFEVIPPLMNSGPEELPELETPDPLDPWTYLSKTLMKKTTRTRN